MKELRHAAPALEANDVLVEFGSPKRDGQPIRQARIQTPDGLEDLHVSAVLLGRELRMSFQSNRCGDKALFSRPLVQRWEELEGYQNRNGFFRRSASPNSNFYDTSFTGAGRLVIANTGRRSLRFRLEGRLYRVAAGSTEALIPSNAWARMQAPAVLLDFGGILDHGVAAVHVRENGVWRRGGVSFCCGDYVDSYHLQVGCGDDWLGVLEARSSYFLHGPRLELLDLESCGPAVWYFRNPGREALPIQTPAGKLLALPPDGRVYRLTPSGEMERGESVQ